MPEADEPSTADLEAEVARLEGQIAPLRAEVNRIQGEVDALRSELRRRSRRDQLARRQATRAELAKGAMPTLADLIAGDSGPAAAPWDALRFLRESATEVRLGYASAARQSVSFTDGQRTTDAYDLAAARDLWLQGWELGTPAARGVRIYAIGSRAERVVGAEEIHIEIR